MAEQTNCEVMEYLQTGFDIPLRDPLWKHVYINKGFQHLIHAQPFSRLSNIRQLSSATLVYPGSRHSRFEHSIGVFWMARRLLQALLSSKNSAAAEFRPSLCGVKAFLAAALLHDLGHFPYAHILEGLESEHEQISAQHICEMPLATIIQQDLGTDPHLVATLIDEALPIPPNYLEESLFYRSLLSGSLDPDKLDYLNRDAYYCGVPYGIQDLEYLFSQVHICRPSDGIFPDKLPASAAQKHSPFRIGIPERGLTIIESLIFSRYLMYRTVYWHRNVRALSAPVREATTRALELGLLEEQQIFKSDDQSFPRLFDKLDLEEKELCLLAQEPRKFLVIDELCLASTGDIQTAKGIGNSRPEESALVSMLRKSSTRREIARSLYEYMCQRCPEIRDSLKPWQVILDLTGPKKMEIADIYISHSSTAKKNQTQEVIPFAESSTVLQPNTLEHFRQSLTMLRLVLPIEQSQKLSKRETLLQDFLASKNLTCLVAEWESGKSKV